jgi:hypothetical protein
VFVLNNGKFTNCSNYEILFSLKEIGAVFAFKHGSHVFKKKEEEVAIR